MTINSTVTNLIMEFEDKFRTLLRPPDKKNRTENFYTEFSRIKGHMIKPKGKYSDWDIYFWFKDDGIDPLDVQQIDDFLKTYRNFSNDTNLFSCPGGGEDILKSLDYMAYIPNEPFAPFIDLHIKKSEMTPDLWSVVYHGNTEDHAKWALLTAWRKLRNSDNEGAKWAYCSHFSNYGGGDELNEFMSNPQTYFEKKFPSEFDKPAAQFLTS